MDNRNADAAFEAGSHLRNFLRERRARISPERHGLPLRGARRRPGLSRDDVAELIGVTPLWYALFESGTSKRRFSLSFLRRLAGVLELDDVDCEQLRRLVVHSGQAAKDVEADWYCSQLGALVAGLEEPLHTMWSAEHGRQVIGERIDDLQAFVALFRSALVQAE